MDATLRSNRSKEALNRLAFSQNEDPMTQSSQFFLFCVTSCHRVLVLNST